MVIHPACGPLNGLHRIRGSNRYWERSYITHQYARGARFPLAFLQGIRKRTDPQPVLIIKREGVGIIASHGIVEVRAA